MTLKQREYYNKLHDSIGTPLKVKDQIMKIYDSPTYVGLLSEEEIDIRVEFDRRMADPILRVELLEALRKIKCLNGS